MLAVASLDFFFAEPRFSFDVADDQLSGALPADERSRAAVWILSTLAKP